MTQNGTVINGRIINIDHLAKCANEFNYKIFESQDKNYNINIWAIRNPNRNAGTFNDTLLLFWKYDDVWHYERFTCTTEPGKYYMLNLINKLGAGIIAPGQYSGSHKLAFHQNKKDHPALVQHRPIDIIRDANKDTIHNIFNNRAELDKYRAVHRISSTKPNNPISRYYDGAKLVFLVEKALGGFNLHRASKYKILQSVGRNSAGCIVQNDYNRYMNKFIPIVKQAADNWSNNFTLTVVGEEDILKYK